MSPSDRAAGARRTWSVASTSRSWRSDPSPAANLQLFAERTLGPIRQWRRRRTGEERFLAGLADASAVIGPLVRGKSVALVGNAASLLAAPPQRIPDRRDQRDELRPTRSPVDEHDVVVRINRGAHVAAKVGTIGARTDALFVSGARMAVGLHADRGRLATPPEHTVFMSGKRLTLPPALTRAMTFYPLAWLDELADQLGAIPSTGAIGIDLVARLLGDGELHLYGFDFWRTGTTYNDRLKVGPHAPGREEAFARSRVPDQCIH